MPTFVAKYVRPYLKAHVATIGAALAMVGADLSNTGSVSPNQAYVAALVALGLGSGVALAANRPFVPQAVAALAPVVAQVVQDVVPQPEAAVVQDVVDAVVRDLEAPAAAPALPVLPAPAA